MKKRIEIFYSSSILTGLMLFLTSFAAASPQTPTAVAVVDLEVPNYLSSQQVSLSDRFRSELVKTGRFIVVERNKMNQVLEEQKLALTGLIDGNSAVKIGKMLGVRRIITGSLAKVGSVFSVSVRSIDVETGKIVNTADMDCECSIEDVLVITLKAVSKKLAGMPVDADGYSRSRKLLPETFTFEEVARYRLPFKIDRYADITWGDDRLYIGTYEGNIYRINTELGLKVEEVLPVKKNHISGMAWDGANLWSAQMGNGYITRFTRTESGLAVDFVFRINGADTYPYAMAIDGDELYTVGYGKKLIRYRILGPTDLKKVEETEVGPYDALAIVDGRMFVALSREFSELVHGEKRPIPAKMPDPCIGMTYDGRYFWILTEPYLYKYKPNRQGKEVHPVSTSAVIIRGAYAYAPQRPVGLVWDGGTLWSMSALGDTAGIHRHAPGGRVAVVDDFYRSRIRANISFDYGSFAWDGKSFIAIGHSFDGKEQKQYVMRLRPVSAKASKSGTAEIQGIEAHEIPLEDISALTWRDGYLWLATGQNTKESGEGSFIHKMKQEKDGRWEIVRTFKYPGKRCQGLAWDESNLWSYDVFLKRFYKHDPDTLDVLAEFAGEKGSDLEYFSGLAWDGKSFWTGNYKTNKIYQIEFPTGDEL